MNKKLRKVDPVSLICSYVLDGKKSTGVLMSIDFRRAQAVVRTNRVSHTVPLSEMYVYSEFQDPTLHRITNDFNLGSSNLEVRGSTGEVELNRSLIEVLNLEDSDFVDIHVTQRGFTLSRPMIIDSKMHQVEKGVITSPQLVDLIYEIYQYPKNEGPFSLMLGGFYYDNDTNRFIAQF